MDKYALKLNNTLSKISSKNRLVFGFWVSKRLFHNYVYFNNVSSFGDIDFLFDAFNSIEKYLKNNEFNKIDIKKAIVDIDKNTPNTEDFDTILASFALDACNALSECLNYILDNKISHIVDIGIFARDTVDMYIQEKEDMDYSDPEFELKIQNNELMVKEMTSQYSFLNSLKNKNQVIIADIVFDKIIEPSLVDN